MKMTEEEAIAYLRTFNAWRCGDESQEAPTPSTVTEAIRTVCDALEAQRRAVPDIFVAYKPGTGCQPVLRSQTSADLYARDGYVVTGYCAAAAPAQPAPETAGDARDAEFHVVVDSGECPTIEAMTSGPRDRALREAMHYAEQYREDGTVTVVEQIEVARFDHPAILAAQGAKS